MPSETNPVGFQNGQTPHTIPRPLGPALGAGEGAFLQDYLQILRRRRAVVVQTFVIITVVALVITLMTRPVYQASAQMLVESPTASLDTVDASNPISQLLAMTQPQSVDTQVEVLQSPSLLSRVAQEAGSATLTVAAVKDTNVIGVTGESHSPKVAADAANYLLRDYIDQTVNQSLNEIKSAEDFARQQEMQARRTLNNSENQLATFKQTHHVAELTADRDQQSQRAASLTSALQQAQESLAALRAQEAANRQQLALQPATVTAHVRTTNARRDALTDKIADLRLQRAGLTQSGGFTDSAPQVKALDAQIVLLQHRLSAQPDLSQTETVSANARRDATHTKIDDLASQEAALKTQVATLNQQLAQARAQMGRFPAWEVTLARLTREHDQAADADKMFASKLADLSLREKAHHATATISQMATVPTAPVRPKKAQNIILGALFGLFAGALMALLQEFLDDRINTVDEANRLLHLPSLGHVPSLSTDDARLLPQMKGMDPAAESYRILRTNIQFASIDVPLRTLLVTSTSPGEGKTTTAANLAFAMAMDGKRVVLVDTDLRRPSLHKLLGLPTMPGVTDVLLGRAELSDALLENEHLPELMSLTSGSTPPNPGELLNSRRFRSLVDELSGLADIVIFDSPPVLVAADSAILASMMDGTVVVVEPGETRKGAARQAVGLLHNARANVLGIMYNKMRALDGHGYYYHYQYHYTTTALTAEGSGKDAEPLTLPEEPNNV